MIARIKPHIQRFWTQTTLSDKLQLISFVVGIIALLFVYFQLREITKTNKVSIREDKRGQVRIVGL